MLLLAVGAVLGGLAGFRLGDTRHDPTTPLPIVGLKSTPTTQKPETDPPPAVIPPTTVSSAVPITSATASDLEVTLRTVLDGDTISVVYRGSEESVRLIGIDTPETGEPFSAEATAALRDLIKGESLRLEFDVEERDQYGRLLAFVWVGSRMVNADILRSGVATLNTVPPNVKHVDTLVAAQDEAQAARLGIWGGTSDSPVEISSIHPDAAGDDNFNLNEEWIEFRVLVAGTLLGLSVEDETGHHYGFPDRIFQPGQLFKLRTGSGTDSQTDLYWGRVDSAVWNNGGDTVKVLDGQGHIMVSRSY